MSLRAMWPAQEEPDNESFYIYSLIPAKGAIYVLLRRTYGIYAPRTYFLLHA